MGANPNVVNRNGDTPLMISVNYANPKKAQTLLEFGADRTLKNKQGKTAEQIAKSPGTKAVFKMKLKIEPVYKDEEEREQTVEDDDQEIEIITSTTTNSTTSSTKIQKRKQNDDDDNDDDDDDIGSDDDVDDKKAKRPKKVECIVCKVELPRQENSAKQFIFCTAECKKIYTS
jgi:ankyrin repeat protein